MKIQTGTDTEGQTQHRQADTCRYWQADTGDTDRQTQKDRHNTDNQTGRHMYMYILTDRQKDRHGIDNQTHVDTDRHKKKNKHNTDIQTHEDITHKETQRYRHTNAERYTWIILL